MAPVPDTIEPIRGWRAWSVPEDVPQLYGQPFQLRSAGGFVWPSYAPAIAECGTCAEIPGLKCRCGLYSANSLDHLFSMGYHNYGGGIYSIVGELACWGRVVECPTGWRAEKAYPVKFYVPYEAWRYIKPLDHSYGVPIELKNILRGDRYGYRKA